MTFVTALIFTAISFLQTGPGATGSAIARPVGDPMIDPATGHSFMIFEFFGPKPYSYEHAARMIKGYHLEGQEGHLAHILDARTHFFVLSAFPLVRQQPVWIGLSRICGDKEGFKWTEGETLSLTPFRAWAADAMGVTNNFCGRRGSDGKRVAVYYNTNSLGTRWAVATPGRDIQYMLVEYPKSDAPQE